MDISSFAASGIEIKPIPGFPGYFATSDGWIWTSFASKSREESSELRRLPCSIIEQRYRKVRLGMFLPDGRRKWTSPMYVHRLVLLAFDGPCPKGYEARHLSGEKLNNEIGNLQWGTPKENGSDTSLHGPSKGERHPMAVLNNRSVLEIRELRTRGMSFAMLAAKFSVSNACVRFIVNRKRWDHI